MHEGGADVVKCSGINIDVCMLMGKTHCCLFNFFFLMFFAACVWVSWFILLGVFPIAAYTNQPEESSPDETQTLCQATRTTGSPITYAATIPLLPHTHRQVDI